MEKIRIISILFVFGVIFWFLPLTGDAATIPVACGSGGTGIQDAITAATSGDTISVTGTCNENVDINKGGITIDGNHTAQIDGPNTAQPTVKIRAGSVIIQNFLSIQGGQDGVYVVSSTGSTILNNTIQGTGRDGVFVYYGGAPTINDNTIQNNARCGITVFANSYAVIINNQITNNHSHGIMLTESADARIGFSSSSDTTASPNTIQSNDGDGIIVTRVSNAWIVGNTISNNAGNGVTVAKVSHAGISDNTINQNGGDGIEVSQGSGVNLGSDSGTSIFDSPNTTSINNSGRGLECFIGGYVDGNLGTLNGVHGKKSVVQGCFNSLLY
jgi:parallel beta-helix repeat protein